MAKSKIIKDLANSSVDTITALKRAKVLFSEFENQELMNWVNYELSGYPADVKLPSYRVEKGTLQGSYIKGTIHTHVKAKDVALPLGKMPPDMREIVLDIRFPESIGALKHVIEKDSNGRIEKPLPADWFPVITKYVNDPYLQIYSARVVASSHCITNIFNVVENRLLDALLLLEKEFGVLDDLDLDLSIKSPEEIEEITKQIIVIIYNDKSVHIGDGNKIKNSAIASTIQDKE